MDAWQVVTISVVVPALITAGLPYLSARLKARQTARLADAEIGQALRDELRADLDRLKVELADVREDNRRCEEDRERLHVEIDQLRHDLTTLAGRVRGYRDDSEKRTDLEDTG